MADRIRTRFLVVGSGVAGLHTALRASSEGEVMVLTKRSLFDSATAYAQGGIAAALGAGDSPELHRLDTLAAGAALCDAKAVEVLVEEGPARVRELQTAGARFDLEPGGEFTLGREAAHSRRRIVHAHGDQTGAEIARTLISRVSDSKRIEVLERTRVLELIVADGRCHGVRATLSGAPVEIVADATVLATGGCGQVYRYTTNPQVATGDGYAIAHRAGVRLADMEFVQFHPTALETPENPLALISEADFIAPTTALVVDGPSPLAGSKFGCEAIFTLYEGVATPEAIDGVMKLGMNHPMGPLQLADFIGLDVCLAILRVLEQGFGDPKYRPCPLLVKMVDAGWLGKKSGRGFYVYAK